MALYSGAFCFHGVPTVTLESLRHKQWAVRSYGISRSRVVSKSQLKVKGKFHCNGLLDLICCGFDFSFPPSLVVISVYASVLC